MNRSFTLECKESLSEFIQGHYEKLKNDMGWDLLFCRYENMYAPRYPIAFFGLNPGGGACEINTISVEGKCDYYNGEWIKDAKGMAPLQLQMKALYTLIGNEVGATHEQLMDGSLMTNLIPVRSRNWDSLVGRQAWLEHSRLIWAERIKQVHCKIYIAISRTSFEELHGHLIAQGFKLVGEQINEQIGWGRVRYQVQRYECDGQASLLVRLPHLSTYKIFSRPACQPAIDRIMAAISSVLKE
ncbi:hypothetical protein ACLH0G_19825 [Aeromonas rivipollensis]|uniref:hypothetical protein n=1 Tax=Aeromonas TaxID=642 RepID=UPI003CFD6B93